MLDSDSDFEYPADNGAQSEASSNSSDSDDGGAMMGKLALGIDPQEVKSYDGRSSPRNGSQYLLKMMAEKRKVPKVAYASPRKLPMLVVTQSFERKDPESINPNYLERFLQMCSAYEEEKGKLGNVSMKLLPSVKWREESVSGFSEARTNIDRWRYRIESAEVFLNDSVKMPQNNDNVHWLRFCFGQTFLQLTATHKSKTAEERLADFFIDVYDPSSVKVDHDSSGEGTITEEVKDLSVDSESGVNTSDPAENGADNNDLSRNESQTASESDSDTATDEASSPPAADAKQKTKGVRPVMGQRPLMNVVLQLDQTQIESLVKWNLLWLKNIGFVNQCQGEWLYAILACLGKPIEPTVMSDFRSIARLLISLRNSISEWSSDLDTSELQEGHETNNSGETTADSKDGKIFDFINTLNLFIYIVADYFQQKDLIMHL